MIVYATKRFSFEAAHYLPNYDGKCSHWHGHSYKMEVTVSRDISTEVPVDHKDIRPTDHMVMDFHTLEKIIKEEVLDYYDHENLNGYFHCPTAECIAVECYDRINFRMFNTKWISDELVLESVKLWETEDCYVEYKGEGR